MEQNSTKEQIQDVFREVMMGRIDVMDSKTLNVWANYITKKSRTLDDLRVFLLKSQDYQNTVKSIFIDMFYERVGDNNYHGLLSTFIEANHEKNINRHEIMDYIVQSEPFIAKYMGIIVMVYDALLGKTPSTDEINVFLKRFQSNESYTVDDLKHDIESPPNEQCDYEDHASNSHQGLHDIVDDNVMNTLSEDQQREVRDILCNPVKIIDMYIRQSASHRDVDGPIRKTTLSTQETIIAVFEEVFNRTMKAREYVFYQDRLIKINTDELKKHITELKNTYAHILEQVQDTFLRYLNENLTEDEFVKTYLPDIEKDGFYSTFKKDILSSEEYKNKMVSRISALYTTLFDETLETHEISYIFKKVQAEECSLLNDDMNHILVRHKNETDSITERIFKIFIDTFDRRPDAHELSNYIQLYRNNDNMEPSLVDVLVENELVASLEYHDVIKQKIKKIYADVKDKPILPSVVYDLLRKILDTHNQATSNIDTVIKNVIQEL